MKWFYIACGSGGGLLTIVLVGYRMWAYFHRYAVATSKADIQINVLAVLAIGIGIVLVPIGIALGLLAAVVIERGVSLLRRRRPERLAGGAEDTEAGGASWVTRRPER